MAPLFFALAAASSDAGGAGSGACLALLPGSPGWQSARCCAYPQELLLQLERSAEIHEIEVAVRSDFAPKAVEVYLSRNGDDLACILGDPGWELAGTARFDALETPRRVSTARRQRFKVHAPCAGQVRLVVHEPVAGGPGNPYRQVGVEGFEIWGYETDVPPPAASKVASGAPASAGTSAASRSGGLGGVIEVLTELGIPLSVVPLEDDDLREVDTDTRQLLTELRRRRPGLLNACKHGEAQQLAEHMQQLSDIGSRLRKLQNDRERLVAVQSLEEAQRLAGPIKGLEDVRLSIAALYETDFWFEQMAIPFSSAARGQL